MFSKTLKTVALATLILGSTASRSLTVFDYDLGDISFARAKTGYNSAATHLNTKLGINGAFPKADDRIHASVIQEINQSQRAASKFVRDAVVSSIFSNLFITKNGAGYKAAAAGLASLVFACYSANQLSLSEGNKTKGLSALIIGQNFTQICNIIYRMLSEGLTPILQIVQEQDDRAKLSFLVRTLYPLITLCMLDEKAVATTAPGYTSADAPTTETEDSIVLKGIKGLDRVLNDFASNKHFEPTA